MSIWTDLESDFRDFVNENGMKILIQNYKQTFHAGSYDESAWSASGTVVGGSCFFMPVSLRAGGDEAQLIQQGKLTSSDRKAYIPSGLEINERADIVVDAGSFDLLSFHYEPNETNIVYKKLFLRSQT